MTEQELFDGFHEALEMEPHPGAWERMRLAMTDQIAVRQPRSLFGLRLPPMAPRVAAFLLVAIIVVAIGAAILSVDRGLFGYAPAVPDPKAKAYAELTRVDFYELTTADFLSCTAIDDTACEATANATLPLVRQWLSDLKALQPPDRYAALDGMVRGHLSDEIAYLNAIPVYQKAGNKKAFSLALEGAFYERAWLGTVASSIEGTYSKTTSTYQDALSAARQSFNSCVTGFPGPGDRACAYLVKNCFSIDDVACNNYAHDAAAQVQGFQISLIQNAAPRSLASQDRALQAHLAQADAALLIVTNALMTGDLAKASLSETDYATAISAAIQDITGMIARP